MGRLGRILAVVSIVVLAGRADLEIWVPVGGLLGSLIIA
jgi:hypothetical protein